MVTQSLCPRSSPAAAASSVTDSKVRIEVFSLVSAANNSAARGCPGHPAAAPRMRSVSRVPLGESPGDVAATEKESIMPDHKAHKAEEDVDAETHQTQSRAAGGEEDGSYVGA